MSLVGASEISVGVSSTNYDTVRKVESDKGISEDIIEGLAGHILRNSNERSLRELSNALKSRPITADHCVVALKIIAADPTVFVVDPKVNYHPGSGLNKFYWEREINLEQSELLAVLDEEKLAALRSHQRVQIRILTVSQSAFDALIRYGQQLARYKSMTYQSPIPPAARRATYDDHQPLIRRPQKQECCCTLL